MNTKQLLLLEQADRKLKVFEYLKNFVIPPRGWIYTVRTALKMSMRALGNRLSISASAVQEMEKREANGTISLRVLQEAAQALDMKLVYGFVSKHESLEAMIEKRAFEIAQEIVLRSHNSMKLEAQENSEERIRKAIEQKAFEIKIQLPKYLWD